MAESKTSASTYLATFSAGYAAGFAVELITRYQSGKFTASGLTHPSFRDNCVIAGTEELSKKFVKTLMRRNRRLDALAQTNPFAFGALSGLPVWALTCFVATPLRNRHDRKKRPYTGYAGNVVRDAAYFVFKNGFSEYCDVQVLPRVLPKVDGFATQKLVAAAVAGLSAGAARLASWPVKSVITGESALEGWYACTRAVENVTIKKATLLFVKPKLLALAK